MKPMITGTKAWPPFYREQLLNSRLSYDDYHRQNSCASMYGTAQSNDALEK
jgi:hypothetical protein